MSGPGRLALVSLRSAVKELETSLSILVNTDITNDDTVHIAEGRLMSALETTKEALSSLEGIQ